MNQPTKKKESINWPTAVIILGIIGTLSLTFTPLLDKALNGVDPAISEAINKDQFESLIRQVNKIDNRSQRDHDEIIEIKATTSITAERVDKILNHVLKKK